MSHTGGNITAHFWRFPYVLLFFVNIQSNNYVHGYLNEDQVNLTFGMRRSWCVCVWSNCCAFQVWHLPVCLQAGKTLPDRDVSPLALKVKWRQGLQFWALCEGHLFNLPSAEEHYSYRGTLLSSSRCLCTCVSTHMYMWCRFCHKPVPVTEFNNFFSAVMFVLRFLYNYINFITVG